ncbi:uncharacterized protein LOC129914367 [Episyrphus balteatus]|uniref:uncharacterized protein LOC129914367 n=1 Tax=Episyrphus balteatus TaxID=286459 RepID=UPI002485DA0E|nr:uncharacterized protein LOC129914367 [Episyrphus balteatus]
MSEICILCGKTAALMCQRCMETYCSTNCQILDWRAHKKICFHIPPLVPINIKDHHALLNRSFVSDSSRNRSLNDSSKTTKRNLARNPLKIPSDEMASIEITDSKQRPEKDATKNSLPDVDFTLKPKIISKENEIKSSGASISSKVSTRTGAWRTPYPYPEGEFFDVMVQYIDEGVNVGIVWVTDLKYESPLRKLLAEINRNIDYNSARCATEEIQVGALIAAPFDNLFYRAEIIEIIDASKSCNVHLIDYGNMVTVPFKDLRSPIPIMRNLNAYAFRIRYSKQVPLETILTIRVVGIEADGVAKIEEKLSSILPVGLTAEIFETNPAVSLVKISENGNYALLTLTNEDVHNKLKQMHELLDKEEAKKLKMDKQSADGDYVAALALNGWSRGLVMSTYRNYYLVYLMDVGRVSLVEQICAVPDEFKAIPMQVFAVELQKVLCDAKNFTDCLFDGQSFTIKAQQSPKTSSDRIPCSMFTSCGKKIAEVETFKYLGKCEKVGVSDWVEPLVSGSTVHVTSAISHSEIYISLVCTKMYPKILSAAAEDCEPLTCAKKGDLVLAKFENEYFRAKIIDAVNESAKVINVDTGLEVVVSIKTMRKPNLFVVSCPYHSRKVKLLYLSNVATPYSDNKALATLEQCQMTGAEFILKFDSNPELGVELVLQTPDHQSLNKQLLPMLFEKRPDTAADFVKEKTPVPEKIKAVVAIETPPPSPKVVVETKKKIYTLQDLEVIPITCGDNVPLMVTDSSTISKGYISACDLTSKAFLRKLESEYLPLVAKHCASSTGITEYSPSLDEICLAIFDADNEWYRALCISLLNDDMFYVMFLDYGNMCSVHKSNIRPITEELMFPANANMCFFEGIPQEVPPKACEKFITATQADPKIFAKVAKLEQDSYLLSLKNMEKYF